jgi:hypothetical protein
LFFFCRTAIEASVPSLLNEHRQPSNPNHISNKFGEQLPEQEGHWDYQPGAHFLPNQMKPISGMIPLTDGYTYVLFIDYLPAP